MATTGLGLKICGVTRESDIDACRLHRVTAIGLNLWPGSPRAVTMERARTLAERARRGTEHRPQLVGVMVDPVATGVHAAFDSLGLDLWQPHGDTPVEQSARIGRPYIWVIRGTPRLSELQIPTPAPAWILLDARVPGYGGQGVTTDWAWAAQAVVELAPVPVWLAGGLGPHNVAQARRQVQPAGLDIASGAEVAGNARHKDPTTIAALAAICHNR